MSRLRRFQLVEESPSFFLRESSLLSLSPRFPSLLVEDELDAALDLLCPSRALFDLTSPFDDLDAVTDLIQIERTPFYSSATRRRVGFGLGSERYKLQSLCDRVSELELGFDRLLKQEEEKKKKKVGERKYTWTAEIKSPEEDGLDRAYKWVAEIKDGKKGAVEKSYKVSAEIKGKGEDSPISRTYTFKTTSGKNAGEKKKEEEDGDKKKKKKKKAVSCARVVEIEEPSDHGAVILRQAYAKSVEKKKGKRKELSPQDAAMVIQMTFRAYLIRRSQALRALRELAIAKTKLKELRALFNNFSYRRQVARDAEERQRFSEKIIVLLLTVDAIEGADVMVRATKKSMVDELEAMLDVVETEGLSTGWYDGGSIFFAVFLVIFVTATSDYRQSLQFQNLNEEKRNIKVEVIRGGRREKMSIYELVVGDIIPLKIGDQVPADGILISGHSLAIDESSMTGESKLMQKDSKSPFLLAGCKVADGAGTMLVTGVGINTEWGLLMASISEDTGEETPLQVRLNGVATFIGIVGLAVALTVLIVLLARFFTGTTKNPDGSAQYVKGKTSVSEIVNGVIHIITAAVTIVVVAVPEGLPLAVTLTLAYSMKKMMADKALVRRLSACETMGSATTICSDKTGTLTLNQMTVVNAYVGKKKIDPPEDGSQVPPVVCRLLDESIVLNTAGSVFTSKDGSGIEVSGSPTEKAILTWGVKLGMKFNVVRSGSVVLHISPFNSTKKRGGVAVRGLNNSQVRAHWKGAAEIILASCTAYYDSNGCVQPIENEKDFFKGAIQDMAARSLRCVAIAYRSCDTDKVPTDEEQLSEWHLPEDDLILLAIVGIKDPCRPGVKDAVRLCTNAGVKVRMVTGDNIQTAKAIALECGILSSDADITADDIIDGKTFRELPEKEREQVAQRISVMGRSSPSDKLLLVQTLRKQGDVVAVTGDGTNDAPALHEADIGLAMGIQGTEVAKESSDIIILDDNFASVVKVVRWGRSVYANIQKFIQFQLTVNVAALVINVVAAISSGDVPLNTVQLLWVNLIMDTLGALALATEPPTDHLMHRPPVGRREPLVTNIMWRNLTVQAVYQVGVLLVLNFCGKSILNLEQDKTGHANMVKNTLVFNAFVLCQIFNEFNARKPDQMDVFEGVMKNHLFVGIVGTTFILQIVIIEFLGKFTSTVRLDFKQWLISLAIGIVSWPLAILGKLIPVPETPLATVFFKLYRR